MKEEKEKRTGPFGKPYDPFKKLTPEERKDKRLKKAVEKAKLENLTSQKKYDRLTLIIAQTIHSFLGFTLARFYLLRHRMFNFMLVGGTGTIVSWLLFNMFRMIIPIEFVAYVTTVLCTFLWNYVLNESWTFKYKNIEAGKDESLNNNTA